MIQREFVLEAGRGWPCVLSLCLGLCQGLFCELIWISGNEAALVENRVESLLLDAMDLLSDKEVIAPGGGDGGVTERGKPDVWQSKTPGLELLYDSGVVMCAVINHILWLPGGQYSEASS
jgi:hypothetical protein